MYTYAHKKYVNSGNVKLESRKKCGRISLGPRSKGGN